MASEILAWDKDGGRAAGGITNDANKFIKNFRVDPITGRLLVDVGTLTITPASDGTIGAAVPTSASYVGIKDVDGALQGMLSAKGALNAYSPTDGKNILATALFAGNKDSGWKRIEVIDSDQDGTTPAGSPALSTHNLNNVFNGTSWDRMRSVANATNSVGTGIQAVGSLAQFDDTSPTSITENSFGNLRISANRNLYGTIRDAAGNERGLNISSRNAALLEGVTASGNAIVAAPVTSGGRAASTNPTAVTDGQVVNQMFDLKGRTVSVLGQFRELRSKQTTTIAASTSETTVGTAVASTFLDLVGLIISNTSATAARVDIRDTTGGSVLFSLYIPAGDVRGFSLPGSSIPQTTVNTNWTAQSSASITDLRVLALFEKNT